MSVSAETKRGGDGEGTMADRKDRKKTLRLLPIWAAVLLLVLFTASSVPGKTKDAMTASFKTTAVWKQDRETFTQMTVTLKNPQPRIITGWSLTLQMDGKMTLVNGWNGSFSVSGKTMTVRPASYNKEISSGGTTQIGFILKSSAKVNCKTMNGTVWNGSVKSTISRNVGKKTTVTPSPAPAPSPSPSPKPTPAPASGSSAETATATPLRQNGRLKVRGTGLVNEKGQSVILKGVSTHGINWYPQYVSKAAFKTLRDSWGVQCIRLAMYTEEYNGYCSGGDASALKKTIQNGVKYATELGLYVIIDWHILSDGNPQKHQKEAVSFFREMSSRYKNQKNVIYEICNEPNGGTSWKTIKTYAQAVIKAIRANDKNAVILVGTPTWSQDVDTAASDPLKGYSNIMYSFHFYAATHGEACRKKVENALKKGLPVFVSEFGISEASGSGRADRKEGDRWISFLKKNRISFVCWNLSNKKETSSLLKSTCTRLSGFKDSDLSTGGLWYKKLKP